MHEFIPPQQFLKTEFFFSSLQFSQLDLQCKYRVSGISLTDIFASFITAKNNSLHAVDCTHTPQTPTPVFPLKKTDVILYSFPLP